MTDQKVRELKKERTLIIASLAYNIGKMVTILVTGVIVVLLLSKVSAQSDRIEELTEGNRAIQVRLEDCTIPGRQCYEEGVARTGKAVIRLSDISKIAAVCADKPGVITAQEMNACIEENLK